MFRKHPSLAYSLIVTGALALAAADVAFADDSSMSMWTGDSYAYFNNQEYSAGQFNVARAPATKDANATAVAADELVAKREHRAMARAHTGKGMPTNPFRSDTGA